ncbi:murein L,D-transpeptidase YcbB/YkuD [Chitinophagaceae bacterium OAS944]|uniref:L,D-transpeptidase family protein n=1 Tax=Niastella sp. OAS944 TaxID=2664089 RepID=UPI0035C8221C|nr:murein L,D-transpeptidase YcbB/YkuD [Chitinophagaceae bacterium OAS944]
MKKCINSGLLWCLFIVALPFVACNGRAKTAGIPEKPKEKDIVEKPEALSVRVVRNIQTSLEFILASNGTLNDSMVLAKDSLVNEIYQKRNFEPVWSNQEKWLPLSDSLFEFLGHAKEYGLFPADYHYRVLENIRTKTSTDTLAQKDAALWTRGEILLTDAFFRMVFDLRKGRLPVDSVTLRKDSMTTQQYLSLFDTLWQNKDVAGLMHALEPKHGGYDSLKAGLQTFLKSAEPLKKYTYVPYPALNSAEYYNILKQRLFEEGLLNSPFDYLDTTSMKLVIGKYQREKGLTETGKLNSNTVNSLNNTSWEKFKRIAITLDRFKLLPDSMPTTYIWVNIPAYRMRVIDSGNVAMESNVIVGQPRTRTPLLTSNVSNFITYPQWTVPYSIVFGEMLSRIKANPDYLRKQNLMVVDKNDSVMNVDSLNWKKFNKNYFPYQIKQRQGDDNSLGVLKFNFANKYSVYLHDTNARWLFSKENRALSHGCVRVKEFMKLADFLVRYDSIRFPPDTLRSWITRQEKHVVSGFPRVPIFIRYFTCEGKNGDIKFYNDVYGEDRVLSQRYFDNKTL